MHLTLLVPGLLLPVEILENTTYDLTAPTLSLMLGSGERRELQAIWLPAAFGLDHLPAAALRKVSSGETAPGDWICLDPVRWHVAAEGVTLDDPARLDLTAEEGAALIESVQPLFAEWGELSSSAPGRWELQLKRLVTLDTTPLPDAIHQGIDPRLPGGADGAAWRRLLAEAQTVLHAHPVNRQREEAGKPTINSLWAWGQGTSPTNVRPAYDSVWSNDPVMAGLCKLSSVPCLQPPMRLGPASGRVLAIVDSLAVPARTLEALAWREALLAFERDWLAPAIKTCQSLRVVGTRFGHQPETIAFDMKRSDRLRFWRKPRPLTELK